MLLLKLQEIVSFSDYHVFERRCQAIDEQNMILSFLHELASGNSFRWASQLLKSMKYLLSVASCSPAATLVGMRIIPLVFKNGEPVSWYDSGDEGIGDPA